MKLKKSIAIKNGQKSTQYYTNAYVKMKTEYRIVNVRKFFRGCEYTTIDNWKEYTTRLVSHEDIYNDSARKSNVKGVRYAVIFTIMIGEVNEQIGEFVKEFVNKVKGQDYAYKTEKKGKAWYVNIMIFEREYLPEGKELLTCAKRDIYRSTKTGRICKQDDEFASLSRKKGDILSSETVYFTNKVKSFCFASEAQFALFIKRIKLWVLKKCKELFDVEIEEVFSSPKFQQGRAPRRINVMKRINDAIRYVDDRANQAEFICKQVDCFDEKAQSSITKQLNKYVEILHDGEFQAYRRTRIPKEPERYEAMIGRLEYRLSQIIKRYLKEEKTLMKKLIPTSLLFE